MTDVTPGKLASDLAQAFGKPDAMADLLTDDVTWWISPTIPPEIMANESAGRETIRTNMQKVFSLLYNADSVRVTVKNAISEGTSGAVRFTLNAEFPNGGAYENEYTVWVEVVDGLISQVWEYCDAAWAVVQMQAAGIDIQPAGA
ncbi:nuclear transport factor 2 family protein [Rhodococcus pyridinivorans]|uniref:nuclear transport factor 2 family protein n=1 Tax=Rhodococcus pyridinivorans TaxID=103816 RepID=UPI002227A804|nr:nuclear transport factor 2 family protein [Rhodococcus pyridinivorans]MCW3472708.1 nuclear transport factor 2 family protein [Rhodococcus pyridinivorans]